MSGSFLLPIVLTILVSMSASGPHQRGVGQNRPEHCTIFYAADENVALAGNNEDGFNPLFTKIWFLPAEKGKYGRAYVGFDRYGTEGGVNDQGLFYDGASAPQLQAPFSLLRFPFPGNLQEKVLAECATVEQALHLIDKYNNVVNDKGQLLLGDKSGDSAIVENGRIIRKQGKYQILTNFRLSQFPDPPYPCSRYNTATGMLQDSTAFSVALFRDVLDATHQAGQAHTLYSTIYDLKRGLIYLFYFHNFEHVVVIDLEAELAKGMHAYDIPSLFPASAAAATYGNAFVENLKAREAELARTEVNPKLLEDYAGRYEISPEMYFLVTCEGNQLFVRSPWSPRVELIAQSDTRFSYVFSEDRYDFVFIRDASGRATELEFITSGEKAIARKSGAQQSALVWLLLIAVIVVLMAVIRWYSIRKQSKLRTRQGDSS